MYPPLELRGVVDDITALLIGKNREVAEMAKKVVQKLREQVERKPQIVTNGKWNGR